MKIDLTSENQTEVKLLNIVDNTETQQGIILSFSETDNQTQEINHCDIIMTEQQFQNIVNVVQIRIKEYEKQLTELSQN